MKKTIRLGRDAVKALCPQFAQKIISREVTLALADDGTVSLEPGKLEDLKAELTERFAKQGKVSFNLDLKGDERETAQAFLYRVCFGEWPEGHEEAEKLALLEHGNVIRDVEIFATGTHNGDTYTVEDLDDMVLAFQALDFKPAVKIGHTKDAPGAPSYGWIENLKRVGQKLVADFSSMHDSVVDAIRKRSYDRVSSEIYFNFKRGGKTFRRALKAVALLGAEVPAVTGLKPLHKMEFAESGFEKVALASEAPLSVTTDALVETLTKRLTDAENLMKEHSMKNAAQIKALKESHTKLATDLEKLKKEKGADAPEVKALSDQAAAILAGIQALEAADKQDANQAARLATLEQREREREIESRCAPLTVPAFAPFFKALFTDALVSPEAKVKVYAKVDGKDTEKEMSRADVLSALLAEINDKAKKIFSVQDDRGGRRSLPERTSASARGEDVAAEVDKLVNEYLNKHPECKGDYAVAQEKVLEADPDLSAKYSESQNPRGH